MRRIYKVMYRKEEIEISKIIMRGGKKKKKKKRERAKDRPSLDS